MVVVLVNDGDRCLVEGTCDEDGCAKVPPVPPPSTTMREVILQY